MEDCLKANNIKCMTCDTMPACMVNMKCKTDKYEFYKNNSEVISKQKVASFLKKFNKWRRGDENMRQPDPKEIGIMIELAIEYLGDKMPNKKIPIDIWVARDKDDKLYLYIHKPYKYKDKWLVDTDNANYLELENDLYPNVKWSDHEPLKIN
jgi:hypothetical protein